MSYSKEEYELAKKIYEEDTGEDWNEVAGPHEIEALKEARHRIANPETDDAAEWTSEAPPLVGSLNEVTPEYSD